MLSSQSRFSENPQNTGEAHTDTVTHTDIEAHGDIAADSSTAAHGDIAAEQLTSKINDIWDNRSDVDMSAHDVVSVVHAAIDLLDQGKVRVAETLEDGSVQVNDWCKRSILLLFATSQIATSEVGSFEFADKIPLKKGYKSQGVRVVPGASARWGSYLAPGVVMMPSYVNIGAYVGANTMVDTWATVGSCAQIGMNVHLSGGVGIGGVLEPVQAAPVIVEDDCLIGSRCVVAEGAIVRRGSILGAGAVLTASIPVIDASTGEELARGEVPAWSVAVAGTRSRAFQGGSFGLPCVLVIKRLSEGERHSKFELNDLLRTHGATV